MRSNEPASALMIRIFVCFFMLLSTLADGQEMPNLKFYPPNWWTGMPEEEFQLMIYGVGPEWEVSISGENGAYIEDQHRVDNPSYVFLDIVIPSKLKDSIIPLNFTNGDVSFKFSYELLKRDARPNIHRGISSSDLIYLIFPDRFANGDESNDVVSGMADTRVDRDSLKTRHGGDIQGIRDRLFHFRNLGVTAVWINPLLTNDQPWESYHGYAITDHYHIDPRFGTLDDYKALVDDCHRSGIKVIMDMVFNHVGAEHDLIKYLPSKDWIHTWDGFQRTSYRAPALMDPHGSGYDRKVMSEGWFDHHMPDLNQQNPLLADFLIQNSIWWIETSGIDAYRIDTYAYSDQDFMDKWARTIKKFYPKFNFFGETWVHGPAIQAHFTKNNNTGNGAEAELPGVTDFQLYYAIIEALTEPQSWTGGAARIYYTLAQDFFYDSPERNVVFLDNHDLSRFYSMVNGDFAKWKMGIGWLLTTRGIPVIYYGTEILMTGHADPDAKVRADFPGGWKSDPVNKFTSEGRSAKENEAYGYIRKLAVFRKKSRALKSGRLMQFVPENGIYVYFRYTDDENVMVVMNTSDKESVINTDRYSERLKGAGMAEDVMSGNEIPLDRLTVAANSISILKIRN